MTSTASPWARRAAKAGWVLVWVVVGLEVVAMGGAGLAKFRSMDGWFYWFIRFGYPARFALVVGAVEFVAAGLLLIPRLASYAAIVLGVVMVGALHAVLTHESGLTWRGPALHLAFLVVIGAGRWKRRWRMSGEPVGRASGEQA